MLDFMYFFFNYDRHTDSCDTSFYGFLLVAETVSDINVDICAIIHQLYLKS